MSIKLFGAISVVGRRDETEATLKTLSNSLIAPYMELLIMVAPTADLPYDDVVKMTNGSKFQSVVIEYWQNKRTWQDMYIHALALLRERDTDYFCWFDNDSIFNPDWFTCCEQAKEQIEIAGNKAGVITPINIPHPAYLTIIKNGYSIKRQVAGTVMLMTKETAMQLPLSDSELWNRSPHDWQICRYLYQRGYIHGCPTNSAAQHIGKTGYTIGSRAWLKRGAGGERFKPDDSIKKWWDRFNG
jgi:hypothetical protein